MSSKNAYSSSSSSLRAPESGGQVQKQWLLCSPSVLLYLPPFPWTCCLQGPSPSGVTAKRESNTSGCRGAKENFFLFTAAIWFARSTWDREGFVQSLTEAWTQRSSAWVLPSVPNRRYFVLSTSLPPVPCNTHVTTVMGNSFCD